MFNGTERMCLEVVIIQDQVLEYNESFNLRLILTVDPCVSSTEAEVAEVTILNDDGMVIVHGVCRVFAVS